VNGYIQISTTTEKKSEAEKISSKLVKMRLAVCAQIMGPIISVYWWKGEIITGEEWLCIIKTHRTLFREVEEVVRDIHPYEVPELVAVPITQGSHDYLSWIDSELKKS
jgi:periplasmic divalent cation tolerance protein